MCRCLLTPVVDTVDNNVVAKLLRSLISTKTFFFAAQMKLSSTVAVVILLAFHVLTRGSTETAVDDDLIQQILNDPQLSSLLDDPDKLMDMLKKKLQSPSKSDNKCSVEVSKRHTIIKTRESKAAGAVFLTAVTVDSPQACVDVCCANSSCSTAIMKQKVW